MTGHLVERVPPSLAHLGNDALFLVWGPPSRGPRSRVFARELGIEVRFVSATKRRGLLIAPFKYASQAVATVSMLLRQRPKLVFVQSPPTVAVMVVALYCALTGGGFIVDGHSAAFQSPLWTRPRRLYAFLARRAIATIVTNEHFAGIVRGYQAVALVVRDIPTTYPTNRSRPNSDAFTVLVVNTFSRDEPLGEVLEAARGLPEAKFYVTGDVEQARGIPAAVPDNVRLTGFLPSDSYYRLMGSCHAVMCLTTRDHTMQRGACEALSAGKPIITSDWPLLRDYFNKGTLHVNNTAEDIRRAVEAMIRDLPRYEEEITALQDEQRREWDAAVRSLVQLIDASLIRQKGRSRGVR